MFDKLMDLLSAAPTEKQPEDDRACFAALLVHAARIDEHYAPEEQQMIDAILAERYPELAVNEVADLRSEGERLEHSATDTVSLTRALKKSVPHEDRVAVIEALWRVVLSDNSRGDDESALLRLSVSLLGVSDQDSGLARQRVKERLAARPNR